jgi:hypothetical protein
VQVGGFDFLRQLRRAGAACLAGRYAVTRLVTAASLTTQALVSSAALVAEALPLAVARLTLRPPVAAATSLVRAFAAWPRLARGPAPAFLVATPIAWLPPGPTPSLCRTATCEAWTVLVRPSRPSLLATLAVPIVAATVAALPIAAGAVPALPIVAATVAALPIAAVAETALPIIAGAVPALPIVAATVTAVPIVAATAVALAAVALAAVLTVAASARALPVAAITPAVRTGSPLAAAIPELAGTTETSGAPETPVRTRAIGPGRLAESVRVVPPVIGGLCFVAGLGPAWTLVLR